MKTRRNKSEYKSRKTEYLMRGKLRRYTTTKSFSFEASDIDFAIIDNERKIGTFSLLPYSDGKTVYFYGFSLDDDLRGQGLGTDVFRSIKQFLHEQGYEEIVLQVSRANEAAFHLYKNNGLRITEAV